MRRGRGRRVLRLVVFLTVGTIAVLGWSRDTLAQGCTSSASLADQSTRGTVRGYAITRQENCSGRKTMVWMRVANLAVSCDGEQWDTSCYASSESGHGHVSEYAVSYGRWDAYSTHKYRDSGGSDVSLAAYTVTLDAGTEEESGGGGPDNPPDEDGKCDPNYPCSPIIISLRNAAYRLTSAADGVFFDINGDGRLEQVGWTPADAQIAFLAVDRDGDGQITSGRELFGNFTLPGAKNGFDALGKMVVETNGGVKRGSISSDDPLFERLLLWTDSNHNGISDPGELRRASEVVSDIGLGYQLHNRRDDSGNLFRYRGWASVRTAPGRNRPIDEAEETARRRQIFDVQLAGPK